MLSDAVKAVVMVVDHSDIHRAGKLASTMAHYAGQLQFSPFHAHCGHHLNLIEGFWRGLKDAIGAGRCFPTWHQLYQRTAWYSWHTKIISSIRITGSPFRLGLRGTCSLWGNLLATPVYMALTTACGCEAKMVIMSVSICAANASCGMT
jgi:hypothetical protein